MTGNEGRMLFGKYLNFFAKEIWGRLDEIFDDERIIALMDNRPSLSFLTPEEFKELYVAMGWGDDYTTVAACYSVKWNTIYIHIYDKLTEEHLGDYIAHEAAHAIVRLAKLQCPSEDDHSELFWRIFYKILKFHKLTYFPYHGKKNWKYLKGNKLIRKWVLQDTRKRRWKKFKNFLTIWKS